MLIMLQGQRGTPPKQRFVTASVRADFEKTAREWKLSNLTVLTPPKSEAPPAPPKPSDGPANPGQPKAPAQQGPGR